VTPDDLAFLTSPRGAALLARLHDADLSDAALLPLLTDLRRAYPPHETTPAIELVRARRAAAAKFGGDAARLFFTREAVEQASHPAARAWRAEDAAASGTHSVLDVCCGAGADAIAFARAGLPTSAVDLDPARAAMARLNAEALGLPIAVHPGDARALDPALLGKHALIFFDPARRDARGRVYHVEATEPPLSTVRLWAGRRVWVKLSPGVAIEQIASYLDDGARLDFISVDGELKEALLRLNEGGGARRAIMHIDGAAHVVVHNPDARAPIAPPSGWLCEPDPAVIRAGAVEQVALACGGMLLDGQIAYFTAPDAPSAPYVRAWRIRAWLPFNVKKLRALLVARGVGGVTVKKRGSPITPEALTGMLHLRGGEDRCTLVLTRWRDAPIVLVCDEYPV
jgi:SAM-dependent methyltransferase